MLRINEEVELQEVNTYPILNPSIISNSTTASSNRGEMFTNFEIGKINYETPFFYFLKNYYKKDISFNSYIYHNEIKFNDSFEPHYLILLTEDLLLTTKFEDETNEKNFYFVKSNPIVLKVEYKTIYDLEVEVLESKKQIKLKLIRSDNFSNFTNLIIYFENIRDLFIAYHLIEKQKTLAWQGFFETKIPISSPFIYQKHFFLQKVNKRGKQQSRVLVFSNKFMYNVSFSLEVKSGVSQFEIESQKWALALEAIKSLTVMKKKKLTIKMYLDKSINKKIVEEHKLKLKGKKEREFLFYTEDDLRLFIFQCRRLYQILKSAFLTVNYS